MERKEITRNWDKENIITDAVHSFLRDKEVAYFASNYTDKEIEDIKRVLVHVYDKMEEIFYNKVADVALILNGEIAFKKKQESQIRIGEHLKYIPVEKKKKILEAIFI